MNLRVIKKDIEYAIGEFIDDCTRFVALNPSKGQDKIAKIIDEAVDLNNNLKDKVNHPEGNKKAFYNGVHKELMDKIDELCEKLSTVVSE